MDKNKILSVLSNHSEMDPDKHDGSYELVRETIGAYATCSEDALDYNDLNLVYLMSVGTWKHGFSQKEKCINLSNLDPAKKDYLIKVLNRIKENAANGLYENVERPGSVGMFGTGFYSFSTKTDKDSVKRFIKLCVDILSLDDDNMIYNIAEKTLAIKIKGMQAGAASMVLHCLKPFTFPVLNGIAGNENTFSVLGVNLKKPGEITEYISNCRKIQQYRDANFNIKNYRIFDIVAWRDMEPSDNKIKNIIKAYKAEFVAIDKEERYKWIAVGTYKKFWNIDDEDFASMLKKSLNDTANLLCSGNYYPCKMLTLFAKKDPETVRALFKTLYDETLPLEERCSLFQKGFDEYYNPQNLRHYQDLHAISVYLTCEYPEKYYIYKYSVVKEFIKQIGYECGNIDAMTDSEKMELTLKLHDTVLKVIEQDYELQELNTERLDTDCYQDGALHMLTNDVIYFGSKYVESEEFSEEMDLIVSKNEFDKNIILYGPPGTGKTYNTAIYAVAIIENKTLEEVTSEDYEEVISRYNCYKMEGKIEFTTFHQSYGYEEFIEGIKPIVNEDAEVSYDIVPGTFKAFCDKIQLRKIANIADDYSINENPNIWKVSLESTGDNLTRKECLENDHIRIGWDSYGENITDETNFSQFGGKNPLNAFINRMRIGDIVLSCYSSTTIDAIGVVTGEYEWHDEYPHYKRLRKVKWLVKDIKENIMDITQGTTMTLSTVYRFSTIEANEILKLIDKHNKLKTETVTQEDNYVFIIDEINRGNISKILGELITLIEPTKRLGQKEEMQAKLPYSQKDFGVPDNVYIIGTMNTADRSIAAIDTALRRRFSFKEMLPQADVLSGIEVDGVSVSKMLEKINRRIEVLYDREHTIGHAYFMPLSYDNSIETLAEIFKNKIIPLLQEYFYEDYDKIRLVLGDNQKTNEPEFIVKEQVDEIELFGEDTDVIEDAYKYSINDSAFTNIDAYKKII